MSTPGGIKLNKPRTFIIHYILIKWGICQNYNIFFISTATWWPRRGARVWTFCANSIISNFAMLPKHKVYDSFCWSIPIKVGHLAINKKFNSGKSLNRNINLLTVSINGCNLSYAFESLGSLFILRGQFLAMPTPWGIKLDKPYSLVGFLKIFGGKLGNWRVGWESCQASQHKNRNYA